ncbi:MBL fold metallo-hydrolase [Undibacterium sp. Di26W]|uniref:MBL fold metallo-hydrolase n=1 Tax=Undibacterium sp. Di26W TaxID=3413035 RepID=UPI003BF3C338
MKQIGDGVYFVSDTAYATIFVVSDKGVIVVDPLPTLGKAYLQAIAEVTTLPVTHIIYSHDHLDHIGAAKLFPASAHIIAQAETRRSLEMLHDPRRPVPDISFDQTYLLELGNQQIELFYPGPNHTPGNIFLYLPRQKILMWVDVVYPGYAPYPKLSVSTDIAGTMAANKKALDYDFDIFVGGHVDHIGNRKDVETSLAFLIAVEESARQVLVEKTFPDYLKATGLATTEGIWFAHDDYEKDRTNACYAQLFPAWEKRLQGLSRSLKSHCWAMLVGLAISLPPATIPASLPGSSK